MQGRQRTTQSRPLTVAIQGRKYAFLPVNKDIELQYNALSNLGEAIYKTNKWKRTNLLRGDDWNHPGEQRQR